MHDHGDGQAPGGGLPALVISLDFELHWGVRETHGIDGSYAGHLMGGRLAIPRILDLFFEYDLAATWATVGFLFAESREELESFHPEIRPVYADTRLNPYLEKTGDGEDDDPLRFAPGLIRLIASTPRQEIGTHTYSHFYCLEDGGGAEAFRHDLLSAVAIGRARGLELKSIVLPRNQWNPAYASVLSECGIVSYRGCQPGWMHRAARTRAETRFKRAFRVLDAHVPATSWQGIEWSDLSGDSGLINIPASGLLRPVGDGRASELRLRRILNGITHAAESGRIFHLWWHPHNFGMRTTENLAFLRRILDHFAVMRDRHGMQSMSMIDAARSANRSLSPKIELVNA
jgi:peptidoglycan/xylan/chitin deacetylase (PgdA/CDA1 family)